MSHVNSAVSNAIVGVNVTTGLGVKCPCLVDGSAGVPVRKCDSDPSSYLKVHSAQAHEHGVGLIA